MNYLSNIEHKGGNVSHCVWIKYFTMKCDVKEVDVHSQTPIDHFMTSFAFKPIPIRTAKKAIDKSKDRNDIENSLADLFNFKDINIVNFFVFARLVTEQISPFMHSPNIELIPQFLLRGFIAFSYKVKNLVEKYLDDPKKMEDFQAEYWELVHYPLLYLFKEQNQYFDDTMRVVGPLLDAFGEINSIFALPEDDFLRKGFNLLIMKSILPSFPFEMSRVSSSQCFDFLIRVFFTESFSKESPTEILILANSFFQLLLPAADFLNEKQSQSVLHFFVKIIEIVTSTKHIIDDDNGVNLNSNVQNQTINNENQSINEGNQLSNEKQENLNEQSINNEKKLVCFELTEYIVGFAINSLKCLPSFVKHIVGILVTDISHSILRFLEWITKVVPYNKLFIEVGTFDIVRHEDESAKKKIAFCDFSTYFKENILLPEKFTKQILSKNLKNIVEALHSFFNNSLSALDRLLEAIFNQVVEYEEEPKFLVSIFIFFALIKVNDLDGYHVNQIMLSSNLYYSAFPTEISENGRISKLALQFHEVFLKFMYLFACQKSTNLQLVLEVIYNSVAIKEGFQRIHHFLPLFRSFLLIDSKINFIHYFLESGIIENLQISLFTTKDECLVNDIASFYQVMTIARPMEVFSSSTFLPILRNLMTIERLQDMLAPCFKIGMSLSHSPPFQVGRRSVHDTLEQVHAILQQSSQDKRVQNLSVKMVNYMTECVQTYDVSIFNDLGGIFESISKLPSFIQTSDCFLKCLKFFNSFCAYYPQFIKIVNSQSSIVIRDLESTSDKIEITQEIIDHLILFMLNESVDLSSKSESVLKIFGEKTTNKKENSSSSSSSTVENDSKKQNSSLITSFSKISACKIRNRAALRLLLHIAKDTEFEEQVLHFIYKICNNSMFNNFECFSCDVIGFVLSRIDRHIDLSLNLFRVIGSKFFSPLALNQTFKAMSRLKDGKRRCQHHQMLLDVFLNLMIEDRPLPVTSFFHFASHGNGVVLNDLEPFLFSEPYSFATTFRVDTFEKDLFYPIISISEENENKQNNGNNNSNSNYYMNNANVNFGSNDMLLNNKEGKDNFVAFYLRNDMIVVQFNQHPGMVIRYPFVEGHWYKFIAIINPACIQIVVNDQQLESLPIMKHDFRDKKVCVTFGIRGMTSFLGDFGPALFIKSTNVPIINDTYQKVNITRFHIKFAFIKFLPWMVNDDEKITDVVMENDSYKFYGDAIPSCTTITQMIHFEGTFNKFLPLFILLNYPNNENTQKLINNIELAAENTISTNKSLDNNNNNNIKASNDLGGSAKNDDEMFFKSILQSLQHLLGLSEKVQQSFEKIGGFILLAGFISHMRTEVFTPAIAEELSLIYQKISISSLRAQMIEHIWLNFDLWSSMSFQFQYIFYSDILTKIYDYSPSTTTSSTSPFAAAPSPTSAVTKSTPSTNNNSLVSMNSNPTENNNDDPFEMPSIDFLLYQIQMSFTEIQKSNEIYHSSLLLFDMESYYSSSDDKLNMNIIENKNKFFDLSNKEQNIIKKLQFSFFYKYLSKYPSASSFLSLLMVLSLNNNENVVLYTMEHIIEKFLFECDKNLIVAIDMMDGYECFLNIMTRNGQPTLQLHAMRCIFLLGQVEKVGLFSMKKMKFQNAIFRLINNLRGPYSKEDSLKLIKTTFLLIYGHDLITENDCCLNEDEELLKNEYLVKEENVTFPEFLPVLFWLSQFFDTENDSTNRIINKIMKTFDIYPKIVNSIYEIESWPFWILLFALNSFNCFPKISSSSSPLSSSPPLIINDKLISFIYIVLAPALNERKLGLVNQFFYFLDTLSLFSSTDLTELKHAILKKIMLKASANMDTEGKGQNTSSKPLDMNSLKKLTKIIFRTCFFKFASKIKNDTENSANDSNEIKKNEIKENEIKENENKENEIKENEIKENEIKENENKENENNTNENNSNENNANENIVNECDVNENNINENKENGNNSYETKNKVYLGMSNLLLLDYLNFLQKESVTTECIEKNSDVLKCNSICCFESIDFQYIKENNELALYLQMILVEIIKLKSDEVLDIIGKKIIYVRVLDLFLYLSCILKETDDEKRILKSQNMFIYISSLLSSEVLAECGTFSKDAFELFIKKPNFFVHYFHKKFFKKIIQKFGQSFQTMSITNNEELQLLQTSQVQNGLSFNGFIDAHSKSRLLAALHSHKLATSFIRDVTSNSGPWTSLISSNSNSNKKSVDLVNNNNENRSVFHWKVSTKVDDMGHNIYWRINRNYDNHRKASALRDTIKIKDENDINSMNNLNDIFGFKNKNEILQNFHRILIQNTSFVPLATEQGTTISYRTTQFTLYDHISGVLYLTDRRILFDGSSFIENFGNPNKVNKYRPHKFVEIPMNRVSFVFQRKHQHCDIGAEIFTFSNKSYFFLFENKNKRNEFLDFMKKHTEKSGLLHPTNLFAPLRSACNCCVQTMSGSELVTKSKLTKKWQNKELSNYLYLFYLNMISGRSFNDISQYPVYPWILSDYTSETIDLNDPAVYRDLSKPIGSYNEGRLQVLLKNLQMDDDFQNCLYRTHFSSPAVVAGFLIRTEPFTTLHIRLQEGRFDLPGRLFFSVKNAWFSVTGNSNDFRELIPEFFCSEHFLLNENGYDLGKHLKKTIDDVELPNWAHSAHEFITIHRMALESDFVSQHLNEWIDLIFGVFQKSEEHNNIFHMFSYSDTLPSSVINDPDMFYVAQNHAVNFGVCPTRLFKDNHPKRFPANANTNSNSSSNLNVISNNLKENSEINFSDNKNNSKESSQLDLSHSLQNEQQQKVSSFLLPMTTESIVNQNAKLSNLPQIDTQVVCCRNGCVLTTKPTLYNIMSGTSQALTNHQSITKREENGGLMVDFNDDLLFEVSRGGTCVSALSLAKNGLEVAIMMHNNSAVTCISCVENRAVLVGGADCVIDVWKNEKTNLSFLGSISSHTMPIAAVVGNAHLDIIVSIDEGHHVFINTLKERKFIHTFKMESCQGKTFSLHILKLLQTSGMIVLSASVPGEMSSSVYFYDLCGRVIQRLTINAGIECVETVSAKNTCFQEFTIVATSMKSILIYECATFQMIKKVNEAVIPRFISSLGQERAILAVKMKQRQHTLAVIDF